MSDHDALILKRASDPQAGLSFSPIWRVERG
jgi:hypothetical protein